MEVKQASPTRAWPIGNSEYTTHTTVLHETSTQVRGHGIQGALVSEQDQAVGDSISSTKTSITSIVGPNEKHTRNKKRFGSDCLFVILSATVTCIVVAVFVVLVYLTIDGFIDRTVKGKAEAILLGAVGSIYEMQNSVISRGDGIRYALANKPVYSSNTYDVLLGLNSTLWKEIGGRQKTNNDSGYVVAIVGPPQPLTDFSQQDANVGLSCPVFCRNIENDAFTNISQFAIFRDEVQGKPIERRLFFSAANNSNYVNIYNLSFVQNHDPIRPSWSKSYEDNSVLPVGHHEYQVGNFLRSIQPLSLYGNGSLFEGGWARVTVTSSPSGNTYYYTAFRQAFIHPGSNLMIILTSLVGAKVFQELLTEHASVLGDSADNRLMIVDEVPRVISYNRDPFGDSRLSSCVITTAPGTEGRNCGDLAAIDHPSAFVRWLFGTHMSYIMGSDHEDEVGQKWIRYRDVRHLMVVKEFLHKGTVRLIAIYVLTESSVVGSLKSDAVVIVIVAAIVIAVGCLMLGVAGFLSLRNAQKTVELTADLAECIGRYDVDGADDVIHDVQGKRFWKEPTSMELQFELILSNLRLYRPYLPESLTLVDTPVADEEDVPVVARRGTAIVMVDQSPSHSHHRSSLYVDMNSSGRGQHRRSGFRAFTGTLLLVDLGNLPLSTIVGGKYHAGRIGQTVSRFLDICIKTASAHRGVVEVLRATQVLVSFNCHRVVADHANVASLCALALRHQLTEVSVSEVRWNTTISVTSGTGIVGTGGSAGVKARVLAGEPYDLIWTLPSLQRMLGVGILVTEAAAVTLPSSTFVTIPVDVVQPFWLQEYTRPVSTVFELAGTTQQLSAVDLRDAKIRRHLFALMQSRGPIPSVTKYLNKLSPATSRCFWRKRLSAVVTYYMSKGAEKVKLNPRQRWCWEPLEGKLFFDTYRPALLSAMSIVDGDADVPTNPHDERGIANRQLHIAQADALTRRAENLEFFESAGPLGAGGPKGGENASLSNSSLSGDIGEEFSGPLFSMFIQQRLPAVSQGSDDIQQRSIATLKGLLSTTTISSELGSAELRSSSISKTVSVQPVVDAVVVAVNKDKYYKTSHVIGQGAFGRVILALHETGGLVAMKQIPLAALEGGVEPLIKEMELLSSLNHPNVSSYVTCAVSRHDNSFCIMTEYLASGSLYDLISVTSPIEGISSTLRVALGLKYAREVVNGLHYLHTRTPPILHLDVKPQNVLMTAEGSCKLIDFGTSKFFNEAQKSMSVQGTPRYMAPEAALGEFSPASDIYSVGITMLHMLHGRLPWFHVPGDDNRFLMRLARDETLRPKIPDWIDPQLTSLLEDCTSRDPSQRPTSAELLDRLERLNVDTATDTCPAFLYASASYQVGGPSDV